MKTQSTINTVGRRDARWRFNPLRNLNPDSLSRYLDSFAAGYLRDAANIWDSLEQRDDLLRTVISKRKKSVARHGWTVLPKPYLSPEQKEEAKRHAEALEFFYSNLECEHATERAEKGGFKLLARQMMDAVGKKFAVHEMVWQREADGSNRGLVSAKFRFVPLAFFENTTGNLRFLDKASATEGRELTPGSWMVTTGDGLMIASSTAWMFKHMSLDDWLKCSQKNGTPGLRGVTAAATGSPEWNSLERSLADLLEGKAIVHSTNQDIQVVDLLPGGTLPFPQLVERIDRLLAALWRGADLSTLSRDRGYGASLQEKETCALEEDDAEMLTETLNRQVDEWVIRHVFGEEVRPLAHVKVLVSPRECTTADLQIDEFLLRNGAPLSIQETMSRYGRALPKPGEAVFQPRKFGDAKESYPESPQHTGAEMENHECGPTVSFRDSSPPPPSSPPRGSSGGEGVLPTESGHRDREFGATGAPAERGRTFAARTFLPLGEQAGEEGQLRDCSPQPEVNQKIVTSSPTMENQFTITQPDWVQLSPYGDFPHSRGLQRVNREAAEMMVTRFNSFRGRLGRLFGGVPFYVGHPDLPHTSDQADRKAYGWITQLEAREEGLYGEVKWSDAGLDLLRNGHFKYLSPYWEAKETGNERGNKVYQPVALVSVGLTNQPNIPVRPLANENNAEDLQQEARENGGKELTTKSTENTKRERSNVDANSVETPGEDGIAAIGTVALRSTALQTLSVTEGLGSRRGELVPLHNRRDRIQECVLSKVRLGLTYDAAWEAVKREHWTWFQD